MRTTLVEVPSFRVDFGRRVTHTPIAIQYKYLNLNSHSRYYYLLSVKLCIYNKNN